MPDDALLQRVRALSIPVAVAVVLLAALLAGWITAILAATTAFGVVVGLRRGGAQILGWLFGLLLAALIAPVLGRALETPLASLLGTAGILNRTISIGACGLLIAIAAGAAAAALARRFLRPRPALAHADAWAGAAFGLLYGVALALAALWIPLSAAPLAHAQLHAQQHTGRSASPFARPLVRLSERARASAMGRLAASTNPLPGSDLFALAADFAQVASHPEALDHFLGSAPMQRAAELPSVQQAFELARADPVLAPMFAPGARVTVESVLRALNSQAVLSAIDQTTVLADLEPLAPDMAQAVRDARLRVPAPPAPPPP